MPAVPADQARHHQHRRLQPLLTAAPELGASGAIAAVLGAYFLLYPGSRIRTWIFPIFLARIPAWVFLRVWFLYQLIEASFGLFSASANGGGVAFFGHAGGFVFGLVVTWLLARAGQVAPQELEPEFPTIMRCADRSCWSGGRRSWFGRMT